jgi:hypothetical protein
MGLIAGRPPRRNERDHALAALGIGQAEHGGGGDGRMRFEHALDLLGENVLARGDDHAFFPADQIKKSLRVEIATIAHGDRLAGAVEIVLAADRVAAEYERARDEHAPDAAGRQAPSRAVADAHPHARKGAPARRSRKVLNIPFC